MKGDSPVNIFFFTESTKYVVRNKTAIRDWLKRCAKSENVRVGELNFIFCSDQYLRKINKQYLNHKTLTDVITFDSSEEPTVIEGDIFISIERVQSNAKELSQTEDEELHRVIIHGVLHLLGYTDKTKSGQILMRKKEDAYLSLRSKL